MATRDSSISGLLMESVISLESSLGQVEKKINAIFSSINNILEFSSHSGEALLEIKKDLKILKENFVYKEDLIMQFALVKENIDEISSVIESFSTNISERLDSIEEILKENSSNDSSKKKGRFGK